MALSKYSVPALDNPTPQEWREWMGQVQALVNAVPNYGPLYTVAMNGNPPVPVVYPGGAAGNRIHEAANLLYASVYTALRGDSLRIATDQQVGDLITMIVALRDEWGTDQQIDHHTTLREIYEQRFCEDQELKIWIGKKWSKVLAIPLLIPANARNPAMIYVLTSLLPSAFDEVCNRARTEPNLQWQVLRSRLVDYDKACPKAKREQSIKDANALVTRVQTAENRLQSMTQQMANLNSQTVPTTPADDTHALTAFEGKCHKCKKWGHMSKDCRVPKGGGKKGGGKHGGKQGVWKGNNKNKNNKGGKKGKGKGKGKW
jgi:hypothetical protein